MTPGACVIGLDIGGTKIQAGLVDSYSAKLLASSIVPTEASRGGAHVLQTCLRLTAELVAKAEAACTKLEGIGIGICEMVDRSGRVTSAQTIDWRGWDAAERFEHWAPTIVDSDARAGALAVARLGQGKQHRNFIYVTLGTGISYAPVLQGMPFAGARGNAIVFANAAITSECSHCGEISRVVLEDFASGPALVRRYTATGKVAHHGGEVLEAAHGGCADATRIVTSAANAAGVGVAHLVNALDPEAVIVGGGLGAAPGLYWDTFVNSLRAHIWAPDTRGLPITQSQMGSHTGVLGAALLGSESERTLIQQMRSNIAGRSTLPHYSSFFDQRRPAQ